MENLLLNAEEHKILIHHRNALEKQFSVKIHVPEFKSSSKKDIIFATVHGSENNIRDVKNFLKEKCENDVLIISEDNSDRPLQNKAQIGTLSDNVIILSDSDTETLDVLTENKTNVQHGKKKKGIKRKRVIADIDLTNSPPAKDDDCKVSSTTEEPVPKRVNADFIKSESYIPLHSVRAGSSSLRSNLTFGTNIRSQRAYKAKKCLTAKQRRKLSRKNSKHRQSNPAIEFIPIDSHIVNNSCPLSEENSLSVQKPVPKDPKFLRPVVIDGSNVAREHGKTDNTFSCKGIKLSIEYFLQRGHTQVTAFVPNFRRHCRNGNIPTTNNEILEELARSGHVVFTPSRRVNGKLLSCYDDRFIVELASKNGGVILSNDNYKDLIGESEAFKNTIEKRLLMFCFVGDLLMIPHDPLGRHGPSLEEYLSFPEKG